MPGISKSLLVLGAAGFLVGLWITLHAACQCIDHERTGLQSMPISAEDVCTFPVGEPASVELRVKNASCSDVRLRKLTTGCTCTSGSISSHDLARGSEAVVTLVRSARHSSGPFVVSAVLEYEVSGEDSTRALTLVARGQFIERKPTSQPPSP
ncbi:MAG: DUF1573 domain-containing protein [Planctomycetaceae bacterium]